MTENICNSNITQLYCYKNTHASMQLPIYVCAYIYIYICLCVLIHSISILWNPNIFSFSSEWEAHNFPTKKTQKNKKPKEPSIYGCILTILIFALPFQHTPKKFSQKQQEIFDVLIIKLMYFAFSYKH